MKQAINTRTQEEYDALMRYYEDKKILWWKDRPAASVNYWPEYKEGMCVSFSMYNPNFLGYSGKSFYEKEGYTIIPYTEFAKTIEPDYKAKYEEAVAVIYLAKGALSDIVNWDEEIEDAFGDQGMRARGPLKQIDQFLTNHKDGE